MASFTAGTMYTNTAGRSAYRGWQFETLAREVLLDIAARDMGIDPSSCAAATWSAATSCPTPTPTA